MFKATIKTSLVPALECVHVDTCLPDYWSGHHLAHVCIPVYGPMTLKDIKRALHSEINQGAIAGNDKRARDDSGEVGDTWFYRAHAAVNKIKPKTKGQRLFFKEIMPIDPDYCGESVYAYFVFRDVE